MRHRIMLVVAGAILCGAALPSASALARSSGTNVYYHDQSGTVIGAFTNPPATFSPMGSM